MHRLPSRRRPVKVLHDHERKRRGHAGVACASWVHLVPAAEVVVIARVAAHVHLAEHRHVRDGHPLRLPRRDDARNGRTPGRDAVIPWLARRYRVSKEDVRARRHCKGVIEQAVHIGRHLRQAVTAVAVVRAEMDRNQVWLLRIRCKGLWQEVINHGDCPPWKTAVIEPLRWNICWARRRRTHRRHIKTDIRGVSERGLRERKGEGHTVTASIIVTVLYRRTRAAERNRIAQRKPQYVLHAAAVSRRSHHESGRQQEAQSKHLRSSNFKEFARISECARKLKKQPRDPTVAGTKPPLPLLQPRNDCSLCLSFLLSPLLQFGRLICFRT